MSDINFSLASDVGEKSTDYSTYLLLGLIGVVIFLFVKDSFFKEGFSVQVPKYSPETDRVPKLSPEQQSVQLDQMVRSEYDDLNRSLMSGAISRRDNHFLVDDGGLENFLVHNMRCSKSCMGQQYPVPHDIRKDPNVCMIDGEEYIPTNLTCSNEFTSGSVCVSKKAWKFLAAKGLNGTYGNPYNQILS